MDTGELGRQNALVERGVEVWSARARLDAELLDTVYELWCERAPTHGLRSAERWVAREFRSVLGLSVREADALVALAIALHERLPKILACMRAGLVDQRRAEQAWAVLSILSDADMAEADRRVAVRVREQGRPMLWRDYLRRVADAIDAQAKLRRMRRARQDRHVSCRPDEDGMGSMVARLSAEDVARCEARIGDVARSRQAAGDLRNLDQLRADATVDLILGSHEAAPASGFAVNVHVPLGVALHLSEQDCWVDGYGDIPAQVAQAMLDDPNNVVRKILLDPDTDVVTGLGRNWYRPSRREQDSVPAPDGRCEVPGCERPARKIRPVHDWYRTRHTHTDDLQRLCRMHHKLRATGRWKYRRAPDDTGAAGPEGRTYGDGNDSATG